ncbi:MAG: phosphotransferase [Bacteroidetes bacterium]|nr:phosphotransferase [Bacteroidota bacterium]MBS1973365.1 phosphotransferase [Bacteroidota bacterium]
MSLVHDTRLSRLVSKIPVLANAKKISALGGGLTNINYKVETENDIYVMRVSDSKSSLLGINRDNERMNTARAHEAGVGAALIGSLQEESVLVISWINATTLHANDFKSNPLLLKRVAASLRMLHAGPAFEGNFHFPAIRKNYLNIVLANKYFVPEQYMELAPKISELEHAIAADPEKPVPCNNDLLAENFMDDGNKIWIIDYEYSGQNEASFEIGNFISESFLGDELLTVLCDAYWQKHDPRKIARAAAWSMIARFGWVMWASIQEAVSPIRFDFRSWGMKKWNSVLPELTGDRYQNVLEILNNKSNE